MAATFHTHCVYCTFLQLYMALYHHFFHFCLSHFTHVSTLASFSFKAVLSTHNSKCIPH